MKEEKLVALVFRAVDYMDKGIPLKDAMDGCEIEEAIYVLYNMYKEGGWSFEDEEE